jgi:hypothetical protein
MLYFTLLLLLLLLLLLFRTWVLQRYGGPRASPVQASLHTPSSSSTAASAAARHSWRVLQLLQPEPGPLGMHCMAFTG